VVGSGFLARFPPKNVSLPKKKSIKMKNLPIGIQSLSEIRAMNCIYVDKTEYVHQLVTTGKYYFLSRPRRFGKSLLISTLKELFLGNKTLFEGLWIANKWDWTRKNPVIHISFDGVDYQGLGLSKGISKQLSFCAKQYGIKLVEKSLKSKFSELLYELCAKYGKVVVLIDEYDKPIIDYLEDNTLDIAKAHRLILRDFYSVIKSADEYLQFVFITGITKFAQVSIFSHLNNLKDISFSENYATLLGYTHTELQQYFPDYLSKIAQKLNISLEILLETMAKWYNGYSWNGVQRVYNPFGTLNFLADQVFQNYWFSTGSPNFLIAQMRKQTYFNVENTYANNVILGKFDIENMDIVPLLFHTGYLTVKERDVMTGEMILDYPNKEVRESMYQFLIDDVAKNQQRTHTGRTIKDLNKAFLEKDLPQVRIILNSLLEDLPDEVYKNKSEGLYHGLIHLIFSYLGMFVDSEVHSSRGRADAVVQTLTDVYIFEFKFNKTAQEALKQIHEKKYANKYKASGKPITGIGVNFSTEARGIDEWLEAGF
jgi:Predicted AAA-ATPase/PD-(D/E)XK nuclease superfamily